MKQDTANKVPADLRGVLIVDSGIEKLWNGLTPIARRDFIGWIDAAKKPETRKKRVERVPDMLAKGKRRPCCYAIVPMNLYKALGADRKAKATWSALTPDERRDFVGWIDAAKESALRGVRIEKICAALAKGKRKLTSL